MSKHNKNYTRYSKMNAEEPKMTNKAETKVSTEIVVDDIVDVADESASNEVIPEVAPIVEPEPAVEPEPTIEPEIRKFGRIRGCKKLNIRKLPNRDAKVLIEVVEGAKMLVDEKSSTAEFYKVCTECGIEGYCMKQYVKLLP